MEEHLNVNMEPVENAFSEQPLSQVCGINWDGCLLKVHVEFDRVEEPVYVCFFGSMDFGFWMNLTSTNFGGEIRLTRLGSM